MTIPVTLISIKGDRQELVLEAEVIPNLGEEIYLSTTRYTVTYRAFDIVNYSQLKFTGLVLTQL